MNKGNMNTYVFYRNRKINVGAEDTKTVAEFLFSRDGVLTEDVSNHGITLFLEEADKWHLASRMPKIEGWERISVNNLFKDSRGYWKKYQDVDSW